MATIFQLFASKTLLSLRGADRELSDRAKPDNASQLPGRPHPPGPISGELASVIAREAALRPPPPRAG